jgi:hypothetical protein
LGKFTDRTTVEFQGKLRVVTTDKNILKDFKLNGFRMGKKVRVLIFLSNKEKRKNVLINRYRGIKGRNIPIKGGSKGEKEIKLKLAVKFLFVHKSIMAQRKERVKRHTN